MTKKYILAFRVIGIFILSLLFSKVNGQINLNGYKYIYIPTLTYKNGETDIFSISSILTEKFRGKGFIVLKENDNIPNEVRLNPCLVLEAKIEQYMFPYKISIILRNCNGNDISKSISEGDNFERATKNAFRHLEILNNSFDSLLTPLPTIDEKNTFNVNEENLKEYYSNTELNKLEGIYKNFDSEQSMPFYRFGIKKIDNKFIAFILESSNLFWRIGDIKAYFEPTAVKNMYSVKWLMGDKKTEVNLYGYLENDAFLNIEFKSEKRIDKFLKIYPDNSGEKIGAKELVKSSGSGFFVSTNGLIATNSHVIEGAKKITVKIMDELGSHIYNAKLELKDSKNDVAIIKIDDADFKQISSLPYILNEKAEVGEKSFTIGFPLNDIMGTNFKITDGLISSNSGLDDDVRYYQISVPIQPGNSGGPLFNKNGDIIGITTAKLNSKAVGANVENVNFAIKISYLMNILNMLPAYSLPKSQLNLNGKELQEQVKILKNYVCIIEVEE